MCPNPCSMLRRVGPTQVAHLRFVTSVDHTEASNPVAVPVRFLLGGVRVALLDGGQQARDFTPGRLECGGWRDKGQPPPSTHAPPLVRPLVYPKTSSLLVEAWFPLITVNTSKVNVPKLQTPPPTPLPSAPPRLRPRPGPYWQQRCWS